MTTFVDTSAILAILNAADEGHVRAAATYRNLLQAGEPLISTNYVLVETIALLQRRLGIAAVSTFQSDILPTLEIEWLTEETHRRAVADLLATSRRRLSLVDCSSFMIMRRRGITRAFAIDPHFVEHGFEQIPP